MAAADITVQQLRLRSQRAVPGLLPSVEDALRVSSKPPALLNRLVLVHRLRLRAAAGVSSQTLALQLERAWQQLAARAQPIEQASDTAEAVWAPSLATARLALLRRWLRGEATEAWFWRRLMPPDAQGEWPQRAVALMLAGEEGLVATSSAAEAQKRALSVRALLELIAEHRMAAQFVEAISDAQALAVLDVVDALRAVPAPARRRLQAASAVPRVQTPRVRLLDAMAAMRGFCEDIRIESWTTITDEFALESPVRKSPVPPPDEPTLATPRRQAAEGATTPSARSVMSLAPQATLDEGFASAWSGLWLLLPLLLRHGLDGADDPLAAWSGAMRAARRRCRIPDDDLIHTALAGLELPATGDSHWLRIARLAAVRDARLPLLRIARRRGSAWISPERIDVEFPPTSLDLRIRRAGFDINPGFVPWLGRIVHFHYPS
ncbi:hypothetical protein ACS5PN_03370 [Roseateles sp. NT4]|uniref:hypothetical protein n=1 Tax=Roseateles sp. NT4 TaxID=3453715 RepID=UPI003EEAC134